MSDMMLNFAPLPPPDHDAGVVWSVVGLVSVVLVATVAARVWWCDRRGSGGPTFVPRQFAAFWLGVGGLITSTAAPTGSVLATVALVAAWALTGLWIVLHHAHPVPAQQSGPRIRQRPRRTVRLALVTSTAVEQSPPIPLADRPGWIWGCILFSLIGSGVFIYVAVNAGITNWQGLYGPHQQLDATTSSVAATTEYIVGYLLLAALGSFALITRHVTTGAPLAARRRSRLHTTALALLLLPTIDALPHLLWDQLGDTWPWMNGPVITTPLPDITRTWSPAGLYAAVGISGTAALVEEVCALAVPLWFATILADHLDLSAQARRIGWWTLGITLVVVRVSYHLGQGPSALAHLPWAIATVVLYYRTRQLAPIIVAHFASDLVVNLTRALHWHSHWQAYTVTAAPTFLAGGVLLLLTRRRARHDPPLIITQPALLR